MTKTKVHIIGAGFSGLSLAWALRRKGIAVCIYEKGLRTGGMISSIRHPELLQETAANGLIYSPMVKELFNELGLEMVFMQETSRARYIWRQRPRRWPLSFFESFQFIFHLLPRMLRKSSLRPQPMETIQSWGERCLGSAATRYLLRPALQGIYGANTHELSASLILGRFFQAKKKKPKGDKYRGTVAPREGMGELIMSLTNWLLQNKVEIRYGSEVRLSDLDGCTVIAAPASEAAVLLQDRAPKLSGLLRQVTAFPLMSVAVGMKNCAKPLRGFGMLVPQEFGFSTLGVLFNNDIFPGRGPYHAETWILGTQAHPQLMSLPDQRIQGLLREERHRLLGDTQEFDFCRITRWPKALPRYSLELEKILEELKTAMDPKVCYLTGNYLGSLGLGQILEKNLSLAEDIAGELEKGSFV